MLYEVKVNNKSSEGLKDYLSSWYTYTIEYLNRVVDIVKDKLPILLHSALIGKSINVIRRPGQSIFADDIIK